MIMDPAKLRLVIQQTLTPLGIYSANAEELLMATCANESNLGLYKVQAKGGPAHGIMQIETATFNDIWANYLAYHQTLGDGIKLLNSGVIGISSDLDNNDRYSVAMARVFYMRCPGALPDAGNLDAIWAYYKQYYNTPAGAAVEGIFKYKYQAYVLGQS